jgi:hypothetical protein
MILKFKYTIISVDAVIRVPAHWGFLFYGDEPRWKIIILFTPGSINSASIHIFTAG